MKKKIWSIGLILVLMLSLFAAPGFAAAEGEQPDNTETEQVLPLADEPVEGAEEAPLTTLEDGGAYVMAYSRPLGTTGSNNDYMGFYDDSLHLAYSTDGASWTALNDNKGMLFYKSNDRSTGNSSKQFRDPYIFEKADGTYGLVATAVRYTGAIYWTHILYWDSADLLNWENQRTLTLSSGSNYPVAPQVKYDGETGLYTILWKGSEDETVYCNTTADFETVSEAAAYEGADYPQALPAVDTANAPEGALIGSVAPVSAEILKGLTDALATPLIPVGADDLSVTLNVGDSPALPANGTIRYSDGATESAQLLWDDVELPNFSQPGTYTVDVPLEGQPDYINPINKNGADPDILKHDGKYYYTSSYMDYDNNTVAAEQYDRIAIREADTIQGLSSAQERVVFERPASGPASFHIWAPEIHYVQFAGEEQGTWVIYFAGGKTTSNFDLHVYAIVCDSQDPMTGNWSDLIEVAAMGGPDGSATRTSFDLDATVFEHNGEWYMIWASKPGTSNLVISQMTDATTVVDPMGGTATICIPDYTWENRRDRVVEGATIMKRDGKIYLGYAAGSTDSTYCMGLMTAIDSPDTDVLDPASWVKTPWPLMITSQENAQFGPGHATFTVAEDDETPILSYHARPNQGYSGVDGYAPLYDATRYARVAVIYFHEDGSPYFGVPPVDGYLPGASAQVTFTVEGEADPLAPDILWYQFDNDTQDATGKGNHGTADGNTTFVQDGANTAISLNSGNTNTGYVGMPNGVLDDVTNFTVASWVKLDSFNSWARIFDFGRSSSTGYMFLAASNSSSASGSMVFGISPRGNATSDEQQLTLATPLAVGKWAHVALTQNGETVTVYINGVAVASGDGFTNNPANSFQGSTSNYIGRSQYSSDARLRGSLDDFRVYGRALSNNEIAQLAGVSGYLPEIVAVEAVELTVPIGQLPQLPAQVEATYSDGTTGTVVVEWDSIDADMAYAQSYTVNGAIAGYAQPIAATVTVSSLSVKEGFGVAAGWSPDESSIRYIVSNYTGQAATANLIYAVYSPAGKMLSNTITPTEVAGGAYVDTEISLALPEGVSADEAIVKVFVWDDAYLPMMSSQSALEEIVAGFSIPNKTDVRGNITLPALLQDTVHVNWASSNESVVSTKAVENENYDPTPAGVVTRDLNGDKVVTLTATFSYNDASVTKEFVLTVKKQAVMDEFDAYLLSGFANGYNDYDNNGRTEDIQQIFFSLSEDGNYYSDMLNGGQPVLTSSLGTGGLRDPYIIRSPEGDRFYLIATDLDARGGDWSQYSNAGSLSIMIWESNDLVNWSEQRMVQIAPDDAGNCWAPEAAYDPITGEYIVFWSSRNRDTGNGHWILYAKTRDFVTFTPAKVYTQQAATGIIDSTIIYDDTTEYWYRYTKWEYTAGGFPANSIYVERSKTLLHSDWEWVNPGQMVVSGGYEGPAIFKYNNENRWGLMVDEYATGARRRFVPLYSTNLAEGTFTFPATGEFQMPTDKRACHGVVLPITRAEYEAIADKWGDPVYMNRPAVS